jgi:hypothetical protein
VALERFWRWYDRGPRIDFAATLLGFIFDWKTWFAALIGGGAVNFFWAAIEGKAPLEVYQAALIAIACFVIIIAAIGALVQTVFLRKAFRFLFDIADANYIRPMANEATRYIVGLQALARHTILFPNVHAHENEFTARMFAERHRELTGEPHVSGPLMIYRGGALDRRVIHPIHLCDLPSRQWLNTDHGQGPLAQIHRFVLEARGRDIPEPVMAEFEYNPDSVPMIRMLP